MSYFNLEFNSNPPTSMRHVLNRRYRGAVKYEVEAPDAPGVLVVWARSESERDEHLRNALFDLIFHRNSCAAFVQNPKCIACGSDTRKNGRNSSGKRLWRCANNGCRRNFVLDRAGRGGANHPAAEQRAALAKLILAGCPVAEACHQLGIKSATGKKWAAVILARSGKKKDLLCPCGKSLRHRGTCAYRREYARRNGGRIAIA